MAIITEHSNKLLVRSTTYLLSSTIFVPCMPGPGTRFWGGGGGGGGGEE